MIRGKNQYWITRQSCFLIVIMNSLSALHEYDLKIQLHRRGLYQTLALHVFTMKFLLKKYTWTHDRKQMWLPTAHLRYLFLMATRPCVTVFMLGAAALSAILRQLRHDQNPADAPTESRGTTRVPCTPTESCFHLQRGFIQTSVFYSISKILSAIFVGSMKAHSKSSC